MLPVPAVVREKLFLEQVDRVGVEKLVVEEKFILGC